MTKKNLTKKNLTDGDLALLRSEAVLAGDFAMVAICDVALGVTFDVDDWPLLSRADARRVAKMSSASAVAEVVKALRHAAAQCVHYPCAHCGTDIGAGVRGGHLLPDAGGDCPACRGTLCQHCAGGWCAGEISYPAREEK